MKDTLDIHNGHDSRLLAEIAGLARTGLVWTQGPHAPHTKILQGVAERADLLVLELSFQTLLRATVGAGQAALSAGRVEEVEDVLSAIAVEAARRATEAARWTACEVAL